MSSGSPASEPFGRPLAVRGTAIPGLLVVDLPVHGDARGWFKENWQRSKMGAVGLPDFRPVQNNVSFNDKVGTTRGIHAEPWDKYVSVVSGRVFGAWVDLRAGDSFGTVFSTEIDPGTAVFVPRGVGNAFQTLEPATVYSYLVNDHWSATAEYTFLNLADEAAAIAWPVPLAEAELSDKDRAHPRLADVTPMGERKVLVLGAGGQLGRALRSALPDAEFAGRAEFDVTDAAAYAGVRWRDYGAVINAAAYTKVDAAETPDGRIAAWAANVTGVGLLAAAAAEHDLTLVTVSSDYVFDGSREVHDEDEPVSPLGVYGQTKAAGDALAATAPRHYVLRTSWVIGEGANFVRTMADLAARGVRPAVVGDQIGRLTFADDLAAGIAHLLAAQAPYGVYNLTNAGPPQSWADIARRVYELTGSDPDAVTAVSTEEYFRHRAAAPRPLNSVLNLTKLAATGFHPRDADDALRAYLSR
ncbi:MAG: dTDP-4-dehydrorhamnose reductase [Naasia sp.]|nr:dTDP-4-dehydrorhamnose reductase [Naasia sp.]